MSTIAHAETEAEIARCYAVMHELRPHLTQTGFVAQVLRQQGQGYRLAYLESDGEVRSAAGYRVSENLVYGRFMYVDDLVTRCVDQGSGHGSALLDWLITEARRRECLQFHLDSGVQRFGAHRFYLHKGMDITSHHFGMRL